MSGLKETLPVLKSELKTVNKTAYIFGGVMGVGLVGVIALCSLAGEAVQSDLNGEKVTHTNCTVNNKQVSLSFIGKSLAVTGYVADTSCGAFNTDSSFYGSLNEGGTYDLTVTLGNWANKPTLVSAAPSGN